MPSVTPDPTPAPKRSHWSGVPPVERRAQRRRLLVDAAFDLLGTEGWSGTTVRGVCQRARLNPRYFYESFDDLDALVVAVYDHVVVELGEAVLTAIGEAAPDPMAQATAAIERMVGFVDDDRRRARVLYVEALGNEALNRRRIETGHRIVDFINGFGVDESSDAPRDPIGLVGSAILVGGLSELLIGWLDGRIDVSREQLVDDATALFLALAVAAAKVAERRSPGSTARSRPRRTG